MLEVVAVSSVLAIAELISNEFKLPGDIMDELEVEPKSLVSIED